ncbi:MAG: hypothetical protein WCX13_04635, partial [Candidatus Hydrogenedentales bacterium]
GAGGSLSLRIEEGRDLSAYLLDPDSTVASSWIGRKDSAFEMIMMALRTARGLDEERFKARFGLEAGALLSNTRKKWKDRFSESEGRLKLDGPGLDILNLILVDALDELGSWFPEAGGEAP